MDGWTELEQARWAEAAAAFRDALAAEETAQAHEGLSWAAWWLDDGDTVFAARERAFVLYRDAGDTEAAARMALWLAVDELDFRSSWAVASGWLQRAERLLENVEPGVEHGWLAFRARRHGAPARSPSALPHRPPATAAPGPQATPAPRAGGRRTDDSRPPH